ncbi:Shedu anti-phage system protein SduA domain-containing protein [Epilithonimonas xixisoli]|uniref:Uncharacterized protein DUF4263 n=1 Tax=Epilithonimonas xixisoli TaxID=1476462 RepID=A0A4R8ICT3_9FLAO|nr:Shedu anti-phage system protein SduA domain-containing protein [Epilithonimonas xixisoli]TDX82071.1 uncharacterized protein DUF4263 [Epilithonimonas xixisoli]
MAFKKTVAEKLETKLKVIDTYGQVTKVGNTFQIDNETFLDNSDDSLIYGTKRFFPNLADPIKEDSYAVTIVLNHDNLKYINSNPINPPKGSKKVYDIFKNLPDFEIDRIVIGANENSAQNGEIKVTKEMYDQILGVDSEERQEKNVRVFNRMVPFLSAQFNIDTEDIEVDRNYNLLLQEILASGEFTQADLINLTANLDAGESSTVVIEKQVTKQTQWLVETVEEILEEGKLNKTKAKNIGFDKFGYTKNSVNGPEHLMEKILTDFGQYSLFGVPALLNTNKYVIHEGVSRSQFDLILINHLGDIELVELKRPDQYLFEFGDGRGKFYPAKDLAIAIAQLERYITAVYKDNDDEYLIDNKKIRVFINDKVGDVLYVESIRPKGLIIIGSWQKLCKPYAELTATQKAKISEAHYNEDSRQAYKELKNSLKNISIMTYSELLENARTRLQFNNDENEE